MNNQQPAALGAPERDGGRRLTVGVLAGWPVYDAEALNPFLGAVLKGFRTAAAEHDCNLLIAAGSEHLLGDAVCQAAWPFAGASSEVAPSVTSTRTHSWSCRPCGQRPLAAT